MRKGFSNYHILAEALEGSCAVLVGRDGAVSKHGTLRPPAGGPTPPDTFDILKRQHRQHLQQNLETLEGP